MKRELKIIIVGLCIVILFSGAVFLGLYSYMGRQTEKDVRNIAQVFLEETANEKENRFDHFKNMRFDRMDFIKEDLQAQHADTDALITQNTLTYAARFQDLTSCSLISESGYIDTVYGDEITHLEDSTYLMESLKSGQAHIVTDGRSDAEQLIIFATPLSVPMTNGENSIGMLWCESAEEFAYIMDLDNPDMLHHFHIIRRDTSYVTEGNEYCGTSYEENALSHALPEGMTREEYVNELYEAMASDAVYFSHSKYIDDSNEGIIRRSLYAMPLEDTNWYLLTVIPYGVLDEAIVDMGHARTVAHIVSVVSIFAVLFAVFYTYLRMMQRQIRALDEARIASEQAKDEAVAANKSKSEFLSNMSHDMRTPMNAIVGMTAIASCNLDDRDQVQDCLRKITLSGKQLLGLINDVLDMSKIESGKMTLNPEVMSLEQTIETIRDIILPEIQENEQDFDIDIDYLISDRVCCDRVRLSQALMNLLSNAMKFTPKGGYISIAMRQEESPRGTDYVRTHISVKDTGIGMSEEFQHKMFAAFEREDNLRIKKPQGTGLGLTITKYIVDSMGGTISVHSELGDGSEFSITVDLEKATDSGSADKEIDLTGLRILLAEDMKVNAVIATKILEGFGCSVEWAEDGQIAFDRFCTSDEGYYDAVLMDLRMPNMNGIETARAIRGLNRIDAATIPIIAMTADAFADDARNCLEAGMNAHIAKPIDIELLKNYLAKYTGR